MPLFRRLPVVFAAVLVWASSAFGQITWNFTYQDVVQSTGGGFDDPTVDPGETLSRGQLRQNSVFAARDYLNNILDGRGTVNAEFGLSSNTGSGSLASYGPRQLSTATGSFQNGGMYLGARTNTQNTTGPSGTGQFNFGYGWNYAGQNNAISGSNFDMVSVAVHEIGHGLGFLSFTNVNGQGLQNNTAGTPDMYSGLDRFLQRGNGAFNSSSQLFNIDITNSGYGSFIGDPQTLRNGNNATNGLFFGGAFAREVYGGAVPMYAPSSFSSGSSVSHVNDSTAVMNPFVGRNSVKRFKAYEIAMLMDAGWNVYQWNETSGGTGSWSTGSTNVSQSRWRSDSGIVRVSGTNYNRNSAQNPAPVLPVYGQVTANIVLNFRNDSGTAYTSTNDFANAIRLSRLTFASNNAAGGITIAGGTLNFGLNANGSASVLAPKIVQNGSGAVTISSAIQTNTIGTQTIDGVTFAGHNGITIEGTGSGAVTLSGNVSGSGGLTKNNAFNLTLSGTNSYTGATTINGGTVFVNGNSSAATGAVTVNDGATLSGNGTVGGAVTVNSGGVIEGGNATGAIGTLAVADNVTVNGSGTLRAQLGSGTASDVINMTGSGYALDLRDGAVVTLVNGGFAAGSSVVTYTLADLNATDPTLLRLNGVNTASDTTITTFTSSGGSAGTSVNNTGQVTIALSGFSLTAGDRLTLRRNSLGDLVIVFTPVPEPGGLLVACGLVAAGGLAWRRWRTRSG